MNIQGYIPHFFSSWDSSVPTGNEESEYNRNRFRSTSYSSHIDDSYKNYRGYAAFENYFLQSGVSEERLPFFANLAKLESGFNPTIQNTAGYPAWGYFQFMDGSWKDSNGKTRSASNVRSIAGVSVNEFLNNPVLQIQSANKLADMFLDMFTERDIQVAREKGYTDSALVAGAWAGGVGGVRKWLHQGYNAVDVSVRNSSSKSKKWKASVAGRMEEFNGYFKNGGIIKKYNTGGPISWTYGDDIQLPASFEIRNGSHPSSNWTMVDNWHPPMLPSYVNSKPDAESSVLGFENAKEVYEYILSLPGSNPAIAAGWTGVFMKESGLDHNAVNKSSGASGIAQLLGTRRTEYKKWLKGRPDNWQNQISWVWEKVNNGVDDWQVYYDALKDKVDRGIKLSEEETKHWNSMKNSKYRNYSFQNYRDKINDMYDPGDIVELMTWTFERPGSKEAHIDQRREYANAVYNQFN